MGNKPRAMSLEELVSSKIRRREEKRDDPT
jgi:hypothetical protein